MKYNGQEVTEEFLKKVKEKSETIFSDFDESDVERILQAAEEVWQEMQNKKIEITLEMKKEIYDKHSERAPVTTYEVGLCEGIETALEAMKVDCGFLGEMAFMDEVGMVTELTDESKTWLSQKYNAQQTTAYGKEGISEGIEFVLNVVGFDKAFLEED